MPLRFVVTATSHPDAREMLTRYFAEIRTQYGFNVAGQASADEMDPPGGRFLVGYEGDVPRASGGIRTWEPGVCEIKRMFVVAEGRGKGYGRELLASLERVAREAGFAKIVLDTLHARDAAWSLYEANGYHHVQPYNENPYAKAWFAKDLAGPG